MDCCLKKVNELKKAIPFWLEYPHCKNGKSQRKNRISEIFHYGNRQVPPCSCQTFCRK